MANDFYGETEITPDELYKYSKGASRLQQIMVNLVLFAVIGVIGWFALPPLMAIFGIAGEGLSLLAFVVSAEQSEDTVAVPRIRTIIAFMLFVFVVVKLVYRFILRPLFRTVFHRTSANLDAVADGRAGRVIYKIDRFGLEYNIQSEKTENRYKQYWRNFTNADYSPEIIRLYSGRKQTAFILMRAFEGRERDVGQFVESTMTKMIEKQS